MRVITKQIGDFLTLQYKYNPTYDCTCLFSLECEVGETWRPEARRLAAAMAKRRGCVIQTRELDAAPWMADCLVPKDGALRFALERLVASIDVGHEFPDAAYSTARAWNVDQSELEALYDLER